VASIAAKEKNIQIQHSIKEPYKLVADYDTLLTVIRNLLSNAVKFTPSGGKVSVEVLKEMNSLKIKISDTGVGIEPENLNKLFKLDGYTTKGTNSESGTGLGLIICKEFTEANGGKIEVASTIGKGTTFTITLPLKND
jgi:signal transduction histidine kinase